jgi:Beta-lactamase enzyme family
LQDHPRAERGRHSVRASNARTLAVLAALGACLIAAAVIIVNIVFRGGGNGPSRGDGTAAAASPAPSRPPSAVSPAPAPPVHADPLAAAAASYISTRAGTVLAAVHDIRTGQTWYLGHGQPQAEASVVKLDILETLLSQQGESTPAGLSASDQALAQEMIEDSDNDAATSLWDAVGGAVGIRNFNASADLTATSPSPCVVCAGFPWPGWGLTTTIPADQIALLRELVEPSRLLTTAERRYALSLMENVTPSQRWGVSGGVPAEVTVALKNGWLPLNAADTDWQINSVGWIWGRGRDYLMAVLSTGNPDEQYGIDTIDQLAAIVWRRMR